MNIINPSKKSKIDLQLHQKLDAVLATRQGTSERSKAMSKLIFIIQNLPGIKRAAHQDYPLALNQTWEWINREIDKFQSSSNGSLEQDFVRWINGYLKWRIRDLYFPRGDANEIRSLSLLSDEIFDPGINHNYIQQLEQQIEYDYIYKQEREAMSTKIENWIILDPEEKLKNCFLKGNSQCNCQILACRTLLKSPPDKLTNISKETGVSYQTLISLWKRRCLHILKEQAMLFEHEHD
jgi:hypothetical protein